MTSKASDRAGGLRERREAAGLTQQALAAEARCSLAIVALYEAGYRPATSVVLPRLLAVLDEEPHNEIERQADKPDARTGGHPHAHTAG